MANKDEQKAHELGRTAYTEGEDIYSNPYPRGSRLRSWWYAGYRLLEGNRQKARSRG